MSHITIGEDSRIKLGLLATLLPVVISLAVSIAISQTRADQVDKRLDYSTVKGDMIEDKIDHISEDVAEIKGMIKEMQRHK